MARTRIVNDADEDVVENRTYNNGREYRDRNTNWLPLLLIPLFLLLGLWALNPRYLNNVNNNQTVPSSAPGEQFGVGGGPADTTSPTVTPTRTPTPTPDEDSMTETVTPEVSVSPSVSPTPAVSY